MNLISLIIFIVILGIINARIPIINISLSYLDCILVGLVYFYTLYSIYRIADYLRELVENLCRN